MKTAKRKTQKEKKVLKQQIQTRTPKERITPANEISSPDQVTESSPAVIFITGESPMVEHYAELCAARGFNVFISWNVTPAQNIVFHSPHITISPAIPSDTSVALELSNINLKAKRINLERLEKALAETAPILSSSITITATEQSSWISHKHRLVGICALPTLIDKPLVEVAPTIYSPKETMTVVVRFFRSIGKEIEIVQDRIGMVLPRILCQVINEAAFSITEDIASPQDIDTAMKLGIRFPLGPIEWAEQIGMKQIYAVLTALYTDLQEERYRVAPLVKQMAIIGEWWQHNSINSTHEMKS